MARGDGIHDVEFLHAQVHVWNHIFSFINSMSLKCAIELGIPDIIHSHGKPMTSSELILALPINPKKAHCVIRLMEILVQSGFFAQQRINDSGVISSTKESKIQKNDSEEDEEGYVLTSASRILLKDNPFSTTPFLLAMLDPVLLTPWHHLGAWFQNEEPTPFDTAHGRTFWDYAGHEPKLNHFFNEAMASDASFLINVVINERKEIFDGSKYLVDVGGGTGTAAKAIAKAFQHLECAVLDLPHVVQGLQGGDNVKFVAGDMFEAIPPADIILLKSILHDWNDEECLKILKQSKEAIKGSPGGKVIIIDMIKGSKKGDEEFTETQFFSDMLMMVLVTGQERSEQGWAKLFFLAGFSDYKITPILGLRSLIEVYP